MQLGLSLREMADRCGTNHTHLSRLETAPERIPSRELLYRILKAIDNPKYAAVVAASAGRPTPAAESAVSKFPRALSEPLLTEQTLPLMRRLEAGAAAEAFVAGLPGRTVTAGRVDPEVLCRAQALRPVIRHGQGPAASFEGDGVVIIRDPGAPADAAALPRVRFLLAHAASHALLKEQDCSFPTLVTVRYLRWKWRRTCCARMRCCAASSPSPCWTLTKTPGIPGRHARRMWCRSWRSGWRFPDGLPHGVSPMRRYWTMKLSTTL